jgi:hypothetical protein
VALDDTGAPQHLCEVITVQPVGFSGQKGTTKEE